MRKLTTDEITTRRKDPLTLRDSDRIPVIAILEDIRSLYNVGSIFRTADAVMISKLFLTGYTPKPPRKEIEKTALGATLTVPWDAAPSASQPIETLRKEGWKICAVESTDRSVNLLTLERPPGPVALVFGNEISGVRQETLDICDQAWEIPMSGTKHSLNVSVAFGVTLYHLARLFR